MQRESALIPNAYIPFIQIGTYVLKFQDLSSAFG